MKDMLTVLTLAVFLAAVTAEDPQAEERCSCKNTILFSYGRSGTSTCFLSLARSAKLHKCERKETFSKTWHPTESRLSACLAGKHSRFIMVKPEHIIAPERRNGTLLASSRFMDSWNSSALEPVFLRDANEFFSVAKKLGAEIVAASFRDNQLARWFSRLEQAKGKPREIKVNQSTVHPMFNNLVARFEDEVRNWNVAVQAAMDARMHVVAFSFAEMANDVCATTQRIASAANCTCFDCKEVIQHTTKSHRNLPPGLRIGKQTWVSVQEQLTGSPYEWMLDLKASSWPADVCQPIPLIVSSQAVKCPSHR